MTLKDRRQQAALNLQDVVSVPRVWNLQAQRNAYLLRDIRHASTHAKLASLASEVEALKAAIRAQLPADSQVCGYLRCLSVVVDQLEAAARAIE